MQKNLNNVLQCISAEGPEDLLDVLNDLYQKNPSLNQQEDYYILYRLGGQKSLVNLTIANAGLQVWHCDLMERPATASLQNIFKQFLQLIGMDFNTCFVDVSKAKLFGVQEDFLSGGEMIPSNHMDPTIYNAVHTINQYKQIMKTRSDLKAAGFFKGRKTRDTMPDNLVIKIGRKR